MTINPAFLRSRATAAVAVAAAVAGLLALVMSGGSAAADGHQAQANADPMRLIARQDVFQFVDNPPSDDSAGDLVIASDKLYNHGGRRLGREHVTGVETVPGKTIALTAMLVLPHGAIALQGVTNEQNDRSFELVITGGTGAYRGASGVERVVPVSRTVSHIALSIRRR